MACGGTEGSNPSLTGCCYGENHPFVRRTNRDHRDDDSARLRRHGRYCHEMRKPALIPSDATRATTSVTVRIATKTAGAYLRYTLDGSIPTGGPAGNGTEIPAASAKISFTVGRREKTLKAIAYKPGLADSSIAEATYAYEFPY
jgi:Chitobiase/beta-hexosaminidase C-terminal domain